MSIMNVSSNTATALIQQLAKSSAKSTSSSSSTSATNEAASTRVSKMGDLMKRLDELSQSDPAKFQEVTASISEQLQQLASTLSGDEASRVSDMASKFADAAKSGNGESLRPSKPPPPPGPPPANAAAYEQTRGMSTDGTDIRSQIDSILSNALSSLTKST